MIVFTRNIKHKDLLVIPSSLSMKVARPYHCHVESIGDGKLVVTSAYSDDNSPVVFEIDDIIQLESHKRWDNQRQEYFQVLDDGSLNFSR